MMFTARVKADGRFFIASIVVPVNRDAHKLEPGKQYQGHVLDSMPTQTHYVEFSKATWETFSSAELEELPGDYRLIKC